MEAGGAVIFSRGGGSGRHAKGDGARRSRRRESESWDEPDQLVAATDDDGPDEPAYGPYDVSDAPAGVPRLDLGSLQIPQVDGAEVRIQASQEGQIQQVVIVHGESALQLGVFAAPRSAGIWEEVREEIRKQLFNDGVAAEQAAGEYGVELRARVRSPEGIADIRFVGVEGPRWLVRAVYQGPAAVDPAVAGPLTECLRGLVVDRGDEAMPVREPLPLRLPREMAEQAGNLQARGAEDEAVAAAGPAASIPAGSGPAASDAAQRRPAAQEPAAPRPSEAGPRRRPSPRPRKRI
jgi:hypothetical protein